MFMVVTTCVPLQSAAIWIKDQLLPITGPPAVGFADRHWISTGLTVLHYTCIKDTLSQSLLVIQSHLVTPPFNYVHCVTIYVVE